MVVNSRVAARIKFGVIGQESNSQSATNFSAKRQTVQKLSEIVNNLFVLHFPFNQVFTNLRYIH